MSGNNLTNISTKPKKSANMWNITSSNTWKTSSSSASSTLNAAATSLFNFSKRILPFSATKLPAKNSIAAATTSKNSSTSFLSTPKIVGSKKLQKRSPLSKKRLTKKDNDCVGEHVNDVDIHFQNGHPQNRGFPKKNGFVRNNKTTNSTKTEDKYQNSSSLMNHELNGDQNSLNVKELQNVSEMSSFVHGSQKRQENSLNDGNKLQNGSVYWINQINQFSNDQLLNGVEQLQMMNGLSNNQMLSNCYYLPNAYILPDGQVLINGQILPDNQIFINGQVSPNGEMLFDRSAVLSNPQVLSNDQVLLENNVLLHGQSSSNGEVLSEHVLQKKQKEKRITNCHSHSSSKYESSSSRKNTNNKMQTESMIREKQCSSVRRSKREAFYKAKSAFTQLLNEDYIDEETALQIAMLESMSTVESNNGNQKVTQSKRVRKSCISSTTSKQLDKKERKSVLLCNTVPQSTLPVNASTNQNGDEHVTNSTKLVDVNNAVQSMISTKSNRMPHCSAKSDKKKFLANKKEKYLEKSELEQKMLIKTKIEKTNKSSVKRALQTTNNIEVNVKKVKNSNFIKRESAMKQNSSDEQKQKQHQASSPVLPERSNRPRRNAFVIANIVRNEILHLNPQSSHMLAGKVGRQCNNNNKNNDTKAIRGVKPSQSVNDMNGNSSGTTSTKSKRIASQIANIALKQEKNIRKVKHAIVLKPKAKIQQKSTINCKAILKPIITNKSKQKISRVDDLFAKSFKSNLNKTKTVKKGKRGRKKTTPLPPPPSPPEEYKSRDELAIRKQARALIRADPQKYISPAVSFPSSICTLNDFRYLCIKEARTFGEHWSNPTDAQLEAQVDALIEQEKIICVPPAPPLTFNDSENERQNGSKQKLCKNCKNIQKGIILATTTSQPVYQTLESNVSPSDKKHPEDLFSNAVLNAVEFGEFLRKVPFEQLFSDEPIEHKFSQAFQREKVEKLLESKSKNVGDKLWNECYRCQVKQQQTATFKPNKSYNSLSACPVQISVRCAPGATIHTTSGAPQTRPTHSVLPNGDLIENDDWDPHRYTKAIMKKITLIKAKKQMIRKQMLKERKIKLEAKIKRAIQRRTMGEKRLQIGVRQNIDDAKDEQVNFLKRKIPMPRLTKSKCKPVNMVSNSAKTDSSTRNIKHNDSESVKKANPVRAQNFSAVSIDQKQNSNGVLASYGAEYQEGTLAIKFDKNSLAKVGLAKIRTGPMRGRFRNANGKFVTKETAIAMLSGKINEMQNIDIIEISNESIQTNDIHSSNHKQAKKSPTNTCGQQSTESVKTVKTVTGGQQFGRLVLTRSKMVPNESCVKVKEETESTTSNPVSVITRNKSVRILCSQAENLSRIKTEENEISLQCSSSSMVNTSRKGTSMVYLNSSMMDNGRNDDGGGGGGGRHNSTNETHMVTRYLRHHR